MHILHSPSRKGVALSRTGDIQHDGNSLRYFSLSLITKKKVGGGREKGWYFVLTDSNLQSHTCFPPKQPRPAPAYSSQSDNTHRMNSICSIVKQIPTWDVPVTNQNVYLWTTLSLLSLSMTTELDCFRLNIAILTPP